MDKSWLLLGVFLLTACTIPTAAPSADSFAALDATSSADLAALPDLGPAPELQNDVFLNTAGPLRLAELRGQVVLLDMWTFG